MTDQQTGMTTLEQNIARLEQAAAGAREATREAHAATRDLRQAQRDVEALLTKRAAELVEEHVAAVVKRELDRIGPQMSEFSSSIYTRVGDQVDKLIDLMLGKEFSTRKGHEDLRPKLAAKLREWMREVLDAE